MAAINNTATRTAEHAIEQWRTAQGAADKERVGVWAALATCAYVQSNDREQRGRRCGDLVVRRSSSGALAA